MTGVESEVEILAQELGCEGHPEIEIDVCRRLVAGKRRSHHALVDEVEEGMARNPGPLCEHRALGKRLRHHAEKHVVADLDDARELALANVACRRHTHLHVAKRYL